MVAAIASGTSDRQPGMTTRKSLPAIRPAPASYPRPPNSASVPHTLPSWSHHFWPCVCFIAAAVTITRSLFAAEPDLSGEAIYSTTCAVCHGAHGEGTDDHAERLEGDHSVAQLAEIIGETMPEDDPGSLTAPAAPIGRASCRGRV